MFSRTEGKGDCGQSTVEAAFLLPVLMVTVLLLVQPGILLYDRMVMQGAAAEACRLLATMPSGDEQCEDFVRRRLGAVPQQENFHVHEAGCTWDIAFEGGESSSEARVTIRTEARPLPLMDAAGAMLGIVNANGNFEVEVSACAQTQPSWVEGASAGRDPATWVGAWLDES